MMNQLNSVTVFAPATSANVAVGFDILGFALEHLGDEVTLTKSESKALHIESITGADSLPYEVQKNVATVALKAMLDYLGSDQGFSLRIKKSIPLSSGLGGSAACSVAPLLALNQFLKEPLSREQLVYFALQGEQIACGAMHGDNVIPCLYGGITLIHSLSPLEVIELPVIPLSAVFVHPHLRLDTRDSRAALKSEISLTSFVKQSAHLASFISALYEKNYSRLALSCKDEVIEPMRASLIPGFHGVKSAAYEEGALACSISGSGPTIFALAQSEGEATRIAAAMASAFQAVNVDCDSIISSISQQGARVVDAS